MKKSLLTTLILGVLIMLSLPLQAVMADYTFTQTTQAYVDITGGTTIHASGVDDAMSAVIEIGFTFVLDDMPYTQFKCNSNGFITLNPASSASLSNNLTTNILILGGLWDDLHTGSTGNVTYLLSGTAPNRILTVQFKNMQWYYSVPTNLVNFQINLHETSNLITYNYGTMGAAPGTSASASIGISGATAGNFISVTPASPTATSSTVTEFNQINGTHVPFLTGNVYNFTPPAVLPNDLQALSMTGPTGPAVGTPADYTITVRNRGTVAQSAYTVQLMSGTNVLASVPGPAIQPGQIIPVVVSHTFTAQGPLTIFGRVNFAADQNLANNDSNTLSIVVQPSGTMLVEIGDGTAAQGQPFYVFWDYTRDASLYTSAEIGAYGAVTAVKWYCATAANYVVPYKIYLKTTTDATITAAPWATMIADATLMLDASFTFSQTGWVTFNFPTPFVYTSGNLLVLVEANIGSYVTGGATFRYTTSPAGLHQYWYADGTPPSGNGSMNTSRPNIGMFLVTAGMGHLTGTVTSGTTPMEGAVVSVDATTYTTTTSTTGTYNIQYIPQGPISVTCSKVGYYPQTLPTTIVENQTTTLNFNMVAQPQVSVTGLVVGSDAPTVGLANAEVILSGVLEYSVMTDASGNFTIPNVLAGNTYAYTITRQGYQTGTGSITIGTTNYNMGTIILNEIALPAGGVQAAETPPNVTVTWRVPGTAGGEWIQYDSGINNDSIGLTAGGTFDVASRWPAADLEDFVGMSLFAVNFFPGDAATYSLRVWTGGSAAAPGQLVVDQPITNYTVDAFNTVVLNNPVSIQAGQELWFGYSVTHTSGFYPAGCDEGPAHDGFGNMIYNAGAWTTLYALAPSLNYDWNLAGYVGYGPPDPTPMPMAASRSLERRIVVDSKGLFAADMTSPIVSPTRATGSSLNTRSLMGYKVWRLLQGNEANETTWTQLTTNTITDTSYVDTGWGTIPEGDYKWAVKAVYTNNVLAPPALSNMVMKRPNDLAALTIAGSLTPSVGTLMNYNITIQNTGTAAQTAGSYTVKIMTGTTELGSAAGPAIAAGQTLDVTVGWTPAAEGTISIYGKVVLTTDTLPANDETPPIDVLVYPAGTLLVEIGDGTSTQRQPFGIWYDYERDAALYTQAEIGAYGAITAMKWYVGTVGPHAVPYKIYLKSTTDATLTTAPWATMITDAQLMLDATFTFTQTGWVTFNFTTPFIYTSGNLLVLVETNIGDYQSSYAMFRYTTAPAGHHLYWYQDGSVPTGNGTANTNRPNIGIYLATAGLGHVSGTVTSGTTPIEGALLTVDNTSYSGTTNASGVYNIQYITAGPQNVTCSKVGYYSQTLPVTIVENQTATLNFNLVTLPQVNVTGLVVGSDAPTVGLADANVALTGMVDYTATTNATGNFTIPNVYASQTYNYTITKAGYSPASGTITIGTTNFNMGTITLNEVAYPATGVQAVEAAPNVNITWTSPDPNVQNFEDSFETYADFAIDFPPWANLDVDQSATYGYNGFDFPGEYGVMAYMVFNPLTTTPNSTTQMGT
ncbi:MAG: carboxypeptidase regulatory-like domain-containing protein, partial [Candidatus Cloacimonadaceae bacterium]